MATASLIPIQVTPPRPAVRLDLTEREAHVIRALVNSSFGSGVANDACDSIDEALRSVGISWGDKALTVYGNQMIKVADLSRT